MVTNLPVNTVVETEPGTYALKMYVPYTSKSGFRLSAQTIAKGKDMARHCLFRKGVPACSLVESVETTPEGEFYTVTGTRDEAFGSALDGLWAEIARLHDEQAP